MTVPEAPTASVETGSPAESKSGGWARWLPGLLVAGTCAFITFYFYNSLWTTSIDLAHNYALTARISEHWRLPPTEDPSLEEMNFYPRYSHRLAAVAGKVTGSPLSGMQFVATAALAVLWTAIGLILVSVPRRLRGLVFGLLIALLIANRLAIHLELFGSELLGNYFYAQMVAQAGAVALIAAVLWLERSRRSPAMGYLVLACAAPVFPQFHLVPGAEILGAALLLVLLGALDPRNADRRVLFVFGMSVTLISLVITALSPAFAAMIKLSANNGLLELRYTPGIGALAIESGIVSAMSGLLIWHWLRMKRNDSRPGWLAYKYLGAFGLATAGLCILSLLMLRLGYGSEYGVKKYAFALNSLLVLEVPLLLVIPVWRRWLKPRLQRDEGAFEGLTWVDTLVVGAFVLLAVFLILPPLSARVIAVPDVVSAERFALSYRQPYPGSNSGKYDYAVGLIRNNPVFDYLISTGTLEAPRANNADDFLNGHPPSSPRRIGRIFSLQGSVPWDVPACRQVSTPDGFIVLDGACVLKKMQTMEK